MKKFLFIILILSLSSQAFAMTKRDFKEICRSGSVQMLRNEIAKDKNFVNKIFDDYETPLIIAADETRNPEIIKLLIDSGANTNHQDEDGDTALMKALDEHNNENANILINSGADVNLRNKDGETAIMIAIDEHSSERIILSLLDAGADVNVRDRKGRSVLDYARHEKRLYGTEALKRIESASSR